MGGTSRASYHGVKRKLPPLRYRRHPPFGKSLLLNGGCPSGGPSGSPSWVSSVEVQCRRRPSSSSRPSSGPCALTRSAIATGCWRWPPRPSPSAGSTPHWRRSLARPVSGSARSTGTFRHGMCSWRRSFGGTSTSSPTVPRTCSPSCLRRRRWTNSCGVSWAMWPASAASRTHLKSVLSEDSTLFAYSHARMNATITRLVTAAVEAGSIRTDVDPVDLLNALGGVCLMADGPGWQDKARRISSLLMDGMRYQSASAPQR